VRRIRIVAFVRSDYECVTVPRLETIFVPMASSDVIRQFISRRVLFAE
jgi:hypothetical protein